MFVGEKVAAVDKISAGRREEVEHAWTHKKMRMSNLVTSGLTTARRSVIAGKMREVDAHSVKRRTTGRTTSPPTSVDVRL